MARRARRLDVISVSLVAFLGGLPIAVPAGAIEISSAGVGTITWGILAGVLFLGLVATAVAMVMWNNSFALLDASLASLTFFAQPVVGSLLGWLLLKESITPLFILGGLLIAAGLIVASRETAS